MIALLISGSPPAASHRKGGSGCQMGDKSR